MLVWMMTGYLSLVGIMSVVAFAAYGIDKRRAVNERQRVPENNLHMFALLGGWPGAWFGQRVFRHKTQKLSFRVVFWAIVSLHIAFIILAAYAKATN
jgi:uncharacterized membrane protein YsdA (DUF1294 family)